MNHTLKSFFVLATVALIGSAAPTFADVRVVSTIPDFGQIAKEIGGEQVEVTALVKPTQDPHYVDARPSMIVDLNRADLLLVAGMELEAGWLPPLLTGSRNSKIQRGSSSYLDCSTLIVPMEVRAPDRAQGDIHPGGNPHYWFDPRNGLRLAQGIAAALAGIDPCHAAHYQSGLAAFTERLRAKMAEWGKRLAARRGTSVVVYHESWCYFLNWAGLVQIGSLEPKPGVPPSPAHVAELIRKAEDRSVAYVIQESFYPTSLSSLFAKKTGASLKVVPIMAGAGGAKTYIDVIERLVFELTGGK
jgi:zinc/manganese transport system substrate-binding protein